MGRSDTGHALSGVDTIRNAAGGVGLDQGCACAYKPIPGIAPKQTSSPPGHVHYAVYSARRHDNLDAWDDVNSPGPVRTAGGGRNDQQSASTDSRKKGCRMFLDLRDQWPPVPPPTPLPETGKPKLNRRGERIIGLIVAINLGLLLLAPIAGTSIIQAIFALLSTMHR